MISRLSDTRYSYSNKMNLEKNNQASKVNPSAMQEKNLSQPSAVKKVAFGAGSGMPIVDGAIGFITWMEKGGKAVDFTVTDCLAMIFPRTFQAYNRNSKELGHPNYKAGTEEALREFLTGPSMFLVPLAFVGLGNKIFGEASAIGFEKLNKFGEVFKSLATDKTTDKAKFYEKILKEALKDKVSEQRLDRCVKVIKKHIDKIENLNKEIANSKNGRHIGQGLVLFIDKKILDTAEFLAKKFPALEGTKNYIKKLIGGNLEILEKRANLDAKVENSFKRITQFITTINNKHSDIQHIVSPDHVSLVKAGAKGSQKSFSLSAKELVTDMMKFGNDVVEKTKKQAETAPEKFKEIAEKLFAQRHGGRILTIATAITATSAFLYCIPKLYQRNKEYPGIDGLVKKPDSSVNPGSVSTKTKINPLLNVYTGVKGGKA